MHDNVSISSFGRLETRRSTGKTGLTALENAISCDRKLYKRAQVDKCARQREHLVIWTFGNASIDRKNRFDRIIENAISCDRKVILNVHK